MQINYDKLNKQQLEAIKHVEGPIIVVAGAGSGKTMVLTTRIAYLIDEIGIQDQRILGITFTNHAANEMRARVANNLNRATKVNLFTYHSLCSQILRHDISFVGGKSDFSVIDEEDQLNIINQIYEDLKLKKTDFEKKVKAKFALSLIRAIKSSSFDLSADIYDTKIDEPQIISDHLKKNIFNVHQVKTIEVIYKEYIRRNKENNCLDFDDLIFGVYKLFKHHEDIRQKWSDKFDYILVDEFQDTDYIQFQILKWLVGKNNNVFAVGDPDQTIYEWRGAYAEIFNDFQDYFAPVKMVILEKNYRSTPKILQTANSLIENNINRIPKVLNTDNNDQEDVVYYEGNGQSTEGRFIAEEIKKLVDEKKVKYQDIVVLYRSNYLSRFIEKALIDHNIPYYIFGGIKFYQRKEIKDVLAYLKILNNFNDELSLRRIINVPRRGIGNASISAISEYIYKNKISFAAALSINDQSLVRWNVKLTNNFVKEINNLKQIIDPKSIANTVKTLIKSIGYEEHLKSEFYEAELENKLQNLNELIQSIKEFELNNENPTIASYLEAISLYTDDINNQENKNHDAVSLMTIHYSKGSEKDIVFLSGLYENVFPTSRSKYDGGLEEERRICFVGITRAKKLLYLTSSYGGFNNYLPSSFIKEIGDHNLKKINASFKSISNLDISWFDSKKEVDYQNMYEKKKEVLSVGDIITHTMFGLGTILEVEEDGFGDPLLTIAFKAPYGKKTIMYNHKAIKRVKN